MVVGKSLYSHSLKEKFFLEFGFGRHYATALSVLPMASPSVCDVDSLEQPANVRQLYALERLDVSLGASGWQRPAVMCQLWARARCYLARVGGVSAFSPADLEETLS